jgi:hypothetical protein
MTDQQPCRPCAAPAQADTTCPDPRKGFGVVMKDVAKGARPVLTDAEKHRPLLGGHRIQFSDFDPGTLGFFLWEHGNNDAGYIATAQHLFGKADPPRLGPHPQVGQPRAKDTDCGGTCTGDLIGEWVNGGRYNPSTLFDLALIRLAPGMTWRAEIAGIGPVRGVHDVSPAEAGTRTYAVMKRGQLSGLTGGLIDPDKSVFSKTNPKFASFHIAPNAARNRQAGDGFPFFALEGDSGSALINDQCQLIGLVVGRDNNGQGIAYSLGVVMKHIQDITRPLGLNLEVATATPDNNPVHTVPTPAHILEPVS